MRLIDADALLNDPANISSNEFGDDVVYVEDINKAPTISSNCKNCVSYQYDQFEKRYFCIHPKTETDDSYSWSAIAMNTDDFCSCYEKRTKDTCTYCKNRGSEHCEQDNAGLYGFCGNFEDGGDPDDLL